MSKMTWDVDVRIDQGDLAKFGIEVADIRARAVMETYSDTSFLEIWVSGEQRRSVLKRLHDDASGPILVLAIQAPGRPRTLETLYFDGPERGGASVIHTRVSLGEVKAPVARRLNLSLFAIDGGDADVTPSLLAELLPAAAVNFIDEASTTALRVVVDESDCAWLSGEDDGALWFELSGRFIPGPAGEIRRTADDVERRWLQKANGEDETDDERVPEAEDEDDWFDAHEYLPRALELKGPAEVAAPAMWIQIADNSGFVLSKYAVPTNVSVKVSKKGKVTPRELTWLVAGIADAGRLPGRPSRVQVRAAPWD